MIPCSSPSQLSRLLGSGRVPVGVFKRSAYAVVLASAASAVVVATGVRAVETNLYSIHQCNQLLFSSRNWKISLPQKALKLSYRYSTAECHLWKHLNLHPYFHTISAKLKSENDKQSELSTVIHSIHSLARNDNAAHALYARHAYSPMYSRPLTHDVIQLQLVTVNSLISASAPFSLKYSSWEFSGISANGSLKASQKFKASVNDIPFATPSLNSPNI